MDPITAGAPIVELVEVEKRGGGGKSVKDGVCGKGWLQRRDFGDCGLLSVGG